MRASAAPVLFLMGPTAAGKTDVAVSLVARLPLEIVSVDSAMVYRGLDIGTGKPDAATLARAPHRLIDIRDPHQPYSAAEFRADALRAVAEIRAGGRVPLLVGGTGLYFRALRYGLTPLPAADPATRRRLEARACERGWPAMHAELAACDPVSAARIRPGDRQRIQRALEVHALAGTPMSELKRRHGTEPCPFAVRAVSLEPASREWLHARIRSRFEAMLEAGLEDEVRGLLARAELGSALPAMRAVGYRQIAQWLRGEGDRDTMRARALAATRQLARRQLTWLRREAVDARVAADDPRRLEQVLRVVGPLLGD